MNAPEKKLNHWFQYFPDHYMWSQGMGMAIEMIPWGGWSRLGAAERSSAGAATRCLA